MFGRSAETLLDARPLARRAATAWKGREPISLHECRHTLCLADDRGRREREGAPSYMGHFPITITLDRYGHLMPGNEGAAAEPLDAYLAHSDTAGRLAQLKPANQRLYM